MKINHLFVMIAFASLCVGCNRQKPITEGAVVSGTVWELAHSNQNNNSGAPIDKASRVTVYSGLIVITAPDGQKQIVPLDRVSGLQLK